MANDQATVLVVGMSVIYAILGAFALLAGHSVRSRTRAERVRWERAKADAERARVDAATSQRIDSLSRRLDLLERRIDGHVDREVRRRVG